ncbi:MULTISPECIES: DUF4124 domain-containing protein [unclassified Halomonas]|uniref:DUF4124 domain-containing protein n=1 Tax=unclassified Halomonas TaxID=2609666 RepID=UPI001CF1DB22|nr:MULTISPECIES: DUF4124 domain-containing protein [unclassified Halomonas]MCA8865533.1 DUF4124 domain-containing protein [Halomonas sp. SBBP1]UZH10393.1 DUF4124 domain-containing protein [Halomonas sp. BDJS001]
MSKVNTVAMSSVLVAALGLGGAAGPAWGQTVYRVTDEHGNVTFTDNPGRGGEALELAPLPVLPPALSAALTRTGTANSSTTDFSTTTPAVTRPSGKPGQPFMPYDHFSIALPQQGARMEEGMTAVEVAIAPPLRDDHQVRLLVNGEISQTALHSDVFWLTGLASGRHELQAELLDSSQRLQHRTATVTITVP